MALGAVQHPLSETGAEDARHYRRRVNLLAVEYVVLLVFALIGVVLLIWKAQLYVTLTQRSNVETLTLAFFFVFFVYLGVISAPGALGGLRIAWYGVQFRVTHNHIAVEHRKMRALGEGGGGAAA